MSASLKSYPELDNLMHVARYTSNEAYCPYSNFHVGAALINEHGHIFKGCNVENASYGLTVCAERSAIFNAVANSSTRIEAIAVHCRDVDPKVVSQYPSIVMSCGACRQVMSEFMKPDGLIAIDHVGVFTLKELLPEAFKLG